MTEVEGAMSSSAWHVTRVPAREVPVPTSIGEEAQAYLSSLGEQAEAFSSIDMSAVSSPDPMDAGMWRAMSAQSDAVTLPIYESWAAEGKAQSEETEVDGVRVYVATPEGFDASDSRVFLEMHGGAFVMGGGIGCATLGRAWANRFGARMWSVDYRMPPDHPYPAGLDDCVAVYRALLRDHQPGEVIVGGGSAGGNLAAALILRARDEGLPLPAAAVLLSPAVDLTWSGDTFRTNMGVDGVLSTAVLMPPDAIYAGGHPMDHPYLSPLFGDFEAGFPPTFLQAGTRDLFLSNAARMHQRLRAAGVDADLHVGEAMPHGGFFGSPEDGALWVEVRRFMAKHWH